ncbi:MAG: hypothetical protein ACXVB9_04395 [Bdellovibrionota bacterium]
MKQKRKNWSLLIGVGLMALVAWSALTSAAEPTNPIKKDVGYKTHVPSF